MPDAIITSTASTFGTITGTFEADQSTVIGTITGIVAGTLDGSVGVPGQQGIPGPVGPQGVPGEGVPAGGEDGQIIVKDGTVDYATIWTDNSAETLTVRATNKTGSTLNKGAVVRINGAQGQRPTIALAQGNSGASADGVIGILLATLANNATGLVCTAGLAKRLNTSAYSEGVKLFLSPTVAGGLTPTRPSAPDHAVAVGIVSHSSATTGSIEVNVVVGDHLEWLHDVLITTPTNGQVLKYDATTSLWKNQTDLNSGVWGSITGTLSSQTDLQSALNAKYDASNPSSYQTAGQVVTALAPYLLSSTASTTYLTQANAASTYYLASNPSSFITSSSLAPYLTISGAAGIYQTQAAMSAYLTTSSASATYYPLSNPANYITSAALTGYATQAWVTSQGYLTASSLTGYATESWVTSQGYLTSSALTPYLTSATASATYQTIAGMAGYATESWVTGQGYLTASALTGYATESWVTAGFYPLTGNPSGFLTSASLTGYATESWVTSQGYLTSAPVTSVAGKTGAVTLTNTDISGLGTMATANASDYSTTTVANGLYYPLSSNPAGYITSAPVTSVAGRTGAITLSNTDISGLGTLATVNDAPSDGSQYARKNGAWDVVTGGSSYITSVSSPLAVSSGNLTVDLSAKADLASPTFTGTPSLPTGTTAVTQTLGDNSTKVATTAFVIANAGGGGGGVDIQTFGSSTTSGTFTAGVDGWVKPAGAKYVEIYLWAGGGGGASGARQPTTSNRSGGGGGAGGCFYHNKINADYLSSTETVVIGSGGSGGSSLTANGAGNAGSNGNDTTFSIYKSVGGNGAASGGAGGGAKSSIDGIYVLGYGAGVAGATGTGNNPAARNGDPILATGGGSGAGQVANSTTSTNGGNGVGIGTGTTISGVITAIAGGGGGVQSINSSATDGTSAGSVGIRGGTGGGGGYQKFGAGNGTNNAGGKGGWPSGGGGGGGSCEDATGISSGAGGSGANGFAVIITYF